MTEIENKHWLVRPKTVYWLWRGGLLLLAFLVLADLFIHAHSSFGIDGSFGFYSWYGLITCVGMVLFAKALGLFLKRKDSYYDND